MDKNSLKKVIKPLIKECLREVLLEEGLNSFSTKEVVKETTNFEKKPEIKKKLDLNRVFNKEAVEKNKKLGFDLSAGEFNPFMGTVPADVLEKTQSPEQKKVSNLINEGSSDWKRILDAVSARK